MNGFLGQLAALTLHQIEALPPRLPGRFEAGSAEPVELDPFDSPAESAAPIAIQAPAVRESMPTPPNSAAKSEGFAGRGTTNLDPPFFRQPQTPSEKPAVQALLMPVPPTIPPTSSHRETPVEPSTPAGADALAPAVDREITRIEERVMTLTQRERLVSRDATPVVEAAGRHRQPEPEAIKSMNSLAAKSEPIVPALTGFPESLTRQPREFQAESAPMPTIQVTIGRIEIRATQISDKAAAKPRPAAATLSLDDYLKQRDGGRS